MRRLGMTLVVVFALVGLVLVLAIRSGRQEPLDVVAAAKPRLGVSIESKRIETNGLHLHVVLAGPEDGRPVVLLHGFPEFWWGWNEQIVRLARAGFRVIVPDQRGYNKSDKPKGVGAYSLDELSADIVGLIESLGYRSVYLAGHDWGGSVAWDLAIRHPEKIRKLVIFNSPHHLGFAEAALSPDEGEETTGWYAYWFQVPWLPETLVRLGNWGRLEESLRNTAREGTFTDRDMRYYKSAWDRDGAFATMVNWYRADFRFPPDPESRGDGQVRVPTRIVWGKNDAFLESRLAWLSAKYCDDGSVTEVTEAGHWILHEEPELTSRLMIEFFSR